MVHATQEEIESEIQKGMRAGQILQYMRAVSARSSGGLAAMDGEK